MVDTVSTSSISFWRQDLNWYVQQQSWTPSFFQQDQSWTERLANSNSPTPATAAAPIDPSSGKASIADQKVMHLVNAQSGSTLTGALQSSARSAPSGSLINLLA
jgi:hypothetical protein